jgi:osmotically-inducible protein OsmY
MIEYRPLLTILFVMLVSLSCGGRNNAVQLNVDLFLHPEGARGDDLILQSAIQGRILNDPQLANYPIHVRVAQGIVFLSGSTPREDLKGAAARLAEGTEVTVNGRQIRPAEGVRNAIEVP